MHTQNENLFRVKKRISHPFIFDNPFFKKIKLKCKSCKTFTIFCLLAFYKYNRILINTTFLHVKTSYFSMLFYLIILENMYFLINSHMHHRLQHDHKYISMSSMHPLLHRYSGHQNLISHSLLHNILIRLQNPF